MAAQVNYEVDYQRGALLESSLTGHATSAMNPVHAVAVEVSGPLPSVSNSLYLNYIYSVLYLRCSFTTGLPVRAAQRRVFQGGPLDSRL